MEFQAQHEFFGASRLLNTVSAEKAISEIKNMPDETKPAAGKKPISKAMKAYLLRAKSHGMIVNTFFSNLYPSKTLYKTMYVIFDQVCH